MNCRKIDNSWIFTNNVNKDVFSLFIKNNSGTLEDYQHNNCAQRGNSTLKRSVKEHTTRDTMNTMGSEKEANLRGIERLDVSTVNEETRTLRSIYSGQQPTAPSAPVMMPQHPPFMYIPGYLPFPRVAGMMQFHQGMLPRGGMIPRGTEDTQNMVQYPKTEATDASQMTVMNRDAKRTSSFMIDAILGLNRPHISEVAMPNAPPNKENLPGRKSTSSISQIIRPHPYFNGHYSNYSQLPNPISSKDDYRAMTKESEEEDRCGDINWGDVKTKRVRTIFTPEQLERLEEEFERQQYMVGTERYYLAVSLNLTEAQVKVWFQNRRIKWRKQNFEEQQAKLEKIRKNQDNFENEVADDIFSADDFIQHSENGHNATNIDQKTSVTSNLPTSLDIGVDVGSLQTYENIGPL